MVTTYEPAGMHPVTWQDTGPGITETPLGGLHVESPVTAMPFQVAVTPPMGNGAQVVVPTGRLPTISQGSHVTEGDRKIRAGVPSAVATEYHQSALPGTTIGRLVTAGTSENT
jgi:hypothetical protein